jgi:hypothetical protein
MSQTGGEPDPSGAEAFEQGDEARDEQTRIDPDFIEDVELDPSLDPTLHIDERELEEVGAQFDEPERKAVLQGGMDDPDGVGPPAVPDRRVGDGWDLDAPLAPEETPAGTPADGQAGEPTA